MLIAGDIGGTKTLLALYAPEQGPRKPLKERLFHSADFASLDDVVRAFLVESGAKATAACFDVAGPVVQGRARLTNLPWVMEEGAMQLALGLGRVSLLNDLKAVAYAVPRLGSEDLVVLNAGKPEPHGQIAVVAPGTGLGEAFLVWDGTRYIAGASEGGHADFGPDDALQGELWGWLLRKFGHVSVERVCSGIGIPNIYDFLRESGFAPEVPEFAAGLAGASDRTPVIMEAAERRAADNKLVMKTLEMFVDILAAEAGNVALRLLASGGVYLAGGIPPRVLPPLRTGRFMEVFSRKGRMGELLRDIPVKVVTSNAALLGAAMYGLDALEGGGV
jgi:glucokinase